MEPHSVDHETRLGDDDHFALKLWLRILTCANLIEARIRHDLRRDFDCTLPRFDLLAQLDREDGLKMSELSQRLMVTGGNVTGLADQLQDEGWLVREPVENDRRATRLRLTEAGRERFRQMARTHEGWVAELLGSLSRDEQHRLHALLGTLKRGLRSGSDATEPPTRRPARTRAAAARARIDASESVRSPRRRPTVAPIVRSRRKATP